MNAFLATETLPTYGSPAWDFDRSETSEANERNFKKGSGSGVNIFYSATAILGNHWVYM
jgi:hypothetical protein